jgi:hypothetical protein
MRRVSPVDGKCSLRCRAPAEGASTFDAGCGESGTLCNRPAHPGRELIFLHEDCGVTRDLDERGVGHSDDRRARCHRLEHRKPEALVP